MGGGTIFDAVWTTYPVLSVITLHLLEHFDVAHLVGARLELSLMASLRQVEVLLSHCQALSSREDLAHIVEIALVVVLVGTTGQDLVELRAGQLIDTTRLAEVIHSLANVKIDSVLVLIYKLGRCLTFFLILVYEEHLVLRRE